MDTKCCGINDCKKLYIQHGHIFCKNCFRDGTRNKIATKQKKVYFKTLKEKCKLMNPLKMTTKKK